METLYVIGSISSISSLILSIIIISKISKINVKGNRNIIAGKNVKQTK